MLSDQTLTELAALAGVVLAQDDIASTHDEICRIAVRAVPNSDGASLTTFTESGPTAAAASDQWARELDELQFREHEGPCLDCVRSGTSFRVRDLTADTRWPSWGPLAVERGALSSMSMPLSAEGRRVGALNLYSRTVDAFDSEAVSLAEVISGHAALASQVAAAFFGHRDLGAQLRTALESRAVIDQAKGVLVATRKVSPDEAFTLLVAQSQNSNRKLREVAAEVVERAHKDPQG